MEKTDNPKTKLLPVDKATAQEEWQRFEEYLVQARYSVRDPKTGRPVEQDMAAVLSRIAPLFKNEAVREAFLTGRIITATPFLMSAGNPHTDRGGYYSCYPLGDIGDSTSSIFDMERDLVTVFQYAGGGGIDVSSIRPKGSLVDHGQGTASGPVSFAKGFSHLSARISQGGKRRGALMIQADWDIKDIKEFVTFKGDEPGKYSGCNASVNVTDEKFWDDKELIRLIAEYIWKSGDPGLLFTKKSLANTPVPAKYKPVYSNPCGEYLSTKDTACNLLSLPLTASLADTVQEFLDNVYENARLAALAGNEILELGGFPPIERIKKNTLKFRPIGIGYTGLHRAMNHFNISYSDPEQAPRFAKAVQLALMLGSMQGSVDYAKFYAKEYGKALKPCEWNQDYTARVEMNAVDCIHGDDWFNLPTALNTKWAERAAQVFGHIREHGGIYNSVTTSQAPTGSISQLVHVACTGIEPYFSMVQNRKVKALDDSWKEFTLVPLEFYEYSDEKIKWVEQQTAHCITPEQQIRILEAAQTFCHTAISKTINLPASTTVEEIETILQHARHSNLKGITMFRDSSMEGVLSDGAKKAAEPVGDFCDLDERPGSTFKFRGPAPLYVTANRDQEGHVREIFMNTTKSGSTLHGLSEALGRVCSVALQHDHRLAGKLARTLGDIISDGAWMNAGLGRVYSIPAAMAKVLEKFASDEGGNPELEKFEDPGSYTACPVCGKMAYRRSGGCGCCTACGHSTC